MLRLELPILTLLVIIAHGAAAQPFEIPAPNVPGDVQGLSPAITVAFGSLKWADYNGDGNFDFLLLGRLPQTGGATVPLFGDVFRSSPTISLNPPGLVYAFFINRTIERLWLSDADWDDMDGDGDLDLVTIGAASINAPLNPRAILYASDGNSITPTQTALPGLHSGAVRWGDLDNDGDPDLAMLGIDGAGIHQTLIFRNEGLGSFSTVSHPAPGLAYGSIAWFDSDKDGDLDLFLSGVQQEGESVAQLYRNDAGRLVSSAENFRGVAFSRVAIGDFDSDADPDLILTGMVNSPKYGSGLTALYRNDDGRFVEIETALPDVYYGDVEWADYDRDGDLDVLLSGRRETFGSRILRACVQGPSATFACSLLQTAGLGGQPAPGLSYGSIEMVDYNKDSELDVMVTGMPRNGEYFTTLYRSLSGAKNTPPLAPSGLLAVTPAGGRVELFWNPASDPNTPSLGLTYELRVGTLPGGVDILAPRASAQTGERRVVGPGRAGSSTSWYLENLAPGTYYWSVQSVDNSYAGSPFAAEQSFTIN